jgi:anaerobic selenocysteine-containing dehydrogenase
MTQYVLSRECDACCGFTFDGKTLQTNKQDPLTLDFSCKCSLQAFDVANRLAKPTFNNESLSWEEILDKISDSLEKVRSNDLSSVGLYVDESVFRRSNDWIRSLSFAASIGTTSIFTDQCRYNASKLLVTEWMIGHATPLLSDLGRSHYIVHLGSDHRKGSWGSLQLGMAYEQQIAHSRKTKGTKLIVANEERSSYAKDADSFFAIRPGTEPFLLLGILHVSVKSGWTDKQYIEKYTEGIEELQHNIKEYSIEKCAEICGITASELSGIALKFTRAPMAVIHPNYGTFSNANATIGAWAWLAVHTISANTLRPGGIYENIGALDLVPVLASLRTKEAPHSKIGNQPLLLMQNMASQLLDEIEAGNISALIICADDILYPQRERLMKALASLECLIVISEKKNYLTEIAHYVLPRSSSWEEDDLMAHRNICLPFYALPYSKAITSSYGNSKSLDSILEELGSRLSFHWRGSQFGFHIRGAAKLMAKGSIENKIRGFWNIVNEKDLPKETGLNYIGETNRAQWRPVDGKIKLAPNELADMISSITIPKPTKKHPFLLRTSTFINFPKTNDIAKVQIHPTNGYSSGEKLWLESPYGTIPAIAAENNEIRTDSLQCSLWENPTVLEILPTKTDPWSGTPILDGVSCSIQKRSE